MMMTFKPGGKAWRALRGAAAVAMLACSSNAVHAVTIAHWDFETDLIAGFAADGQTVSHPSATGLHDDALQDISGNGNHLSAFAQDGGFTRQAFSSNSVGGNFSVENDSTQCCPTLSTGEPSVDGVNPSFGGDLKLGGSPVGALANWTIEASVNMKNLGGWRTFVGKDGVGQATNGDALQAPLYLQKTGDGNQRFRINYVDVDGYGHILDSTTVAQPNLWYNLAATSDGNTLSLYVNGVLESTLDMTAGMSTDRSMVALDEAGASGTAPYAWTLFRGMYNNGHGDRVDGYIDDVRISNDVLTPGQFLHTDAPRFALVVDPNTGEAFLRNGTNAAITFDYYKIASPTNGALSVANWDSLDDQDKDSIGAAAGESWDEVTAANSVNQLIEQFLLGDTTIPAQSAIAIGTPFNTALSSSDLEFWYASPGGALIQSRVIVTAGVVGDYNGNGVVDLGDYNVWRDNLNSTTFNLPNRDPSSTGAVSMTDYNVWVNNFGMTEGAGAIAGLSAVPEPATLALLAVGLLAVGYRRR